MNVIPPLYEKEVHFPNIDDTELKRLENNHNKRKTLKETTSCFKRNMLVALPPVLFL